MTKPDPCELTVRGSVPPPGRWRLKKSSNMSRNGTSGGRSGICSWTPPEAFCVVAIDTTAGESFSARSATVGSC